MVVQELAEAASGQQVRRLELTLVNQDFQLVKLAVLLVSLMNLAACCLP